MQKLSKAKSLKLLNESKGPFIIKHEIGLIDGMKAFFQRVLLQENRKYILTIYSTAKNGGCFI